MSAGGGSCINARAVGVTGAADGRCYSSTPTSRMIPGRGLTQSFVAPMVPANGDTYTLQNNRTGEMLARALEGAFTRNDRNRGLLGRTSLAPGAGLVIAPCSSVHTWFMKFAIDVIFVGRDGRVRKIARAVPPWRMAIGFGSFAVVELPAHAASATQAGDVLTIQVSSTARQAP